MVSMTLMCIAGLLVRFTPGTELIGTAVLPPGTPDASGLVEPLAWGLPHNLLGGFGSGLVYTGKGEEYLAVSDRGPQDGATPFATRFHTLRVEVRPGAAEPVRVEVLRTALLRDERGERYIGAAAAFDAMDQRAAMRLDPEAIALGPNGSVWTSDEYGPWIDEWTREGVHLRRIAPPEKFRVTRVGALPAEESPPRNASGRQVNRGLEGTALSPDGSRLFAIAQSPLIQDGAVDGRGKRIGTNIRMFEYALSEDGAVVDWREFVYVLDSPGFGINELTLVGDRTFLVIEKDGNGGELARVRRIYRIDLAEATDVTRTAALPSRGVPEGVRPVRKTLVLDMLWPRFGLAGTTMPEKVEGLAIGPDLPDGRVIVLIASDNDYRLNQPSYLWAFAVDRALLPGLERARAHEMGVGAR